MAENWLEVYLHAMERGFYDQGGKPEFTVPVGMQLYYLHNPDNNVEFNEPETDQKDAASQPEVYQGRYSAVIMFTYSTGCAWLIGDPVYVQNGRPLRASAMYMHVFDRAGGGARLGLVDGDGLFLDRHAFAPTERGAVSAPVSWGGWKSTYDGVAQRKWVQLEAPQLVPTKGSIRAVVEFASNDSGFAAGHFDVFRVEQLVGQEPPPEGGATVDYDRIERIVHAAVREELDQTWLTGSLCGGVP